MGKIYMAVNAIDGMVYVGQTKAKYLCKRKAQHKYDAVNYRKGEGCKFHEAIRKYGIGAFEFSVIEEVPNKMLDEKEAQWIEFHKNHAYNVKEVIAH